MDSSADWVKLSFLHDAKEMMQSVKNKDIDNLITAVPDQEVVTVVAAMVEVITAIIIAACTP